MNRSSAEAGFTLIEVLVSLAILAVSMAVLFGLLSDGLARVRTSEAEAVAGSLAQSLLAGAGVEHPLQAGDTTGEFNNGFHWRLHVVPYGTAEDRLAWAVSAYAVTASVSWRDGIAPKSMELTTLRLAPKDAQR